ncbi:MAG: MoxR family ATPase [Blastocatellia bacterium]
METIKYYKGRPEVPPAKSPVSIPSMVYNKKRDAASYIAGEQLVDAVNVALILNQPLLLTGEPGTGKTQLAYSVGRELGYDVLKFETKSTSAARDLFYTYDTLRRFHDAQLRVKRRSNEYISYNAFGAAILRTREREEVAQWLPSSFEHDEPRQSIVLIDEIDKAPRDFPNDLLNEIEGMYFKVAELGMTNEKIEANQEMRPIIFITSNSEKSLPDAFLRRCIFYDIPFPSRDRLTDIVLSHMADAVDKKHTWLEDAMDFFLKLREPGRGLDKKPATAELLNWIAYLRKSSIQDSEHLRVKKGLINSSLSVLFKSKSDQARANSILDEWLKELPR